jgi:hypothetical protein
VRERCETDRGHVLVRIGRAPKRAIPFRTDAPFKKITANLIAVGGSEGQKIELLADGQQVVAFGIHPDTDKPYCWFGGEPGKIARDELPYISEAQAHQLVDDIVELLTREHSYRRAAERPRHKKANGGDADDRTADWQYLVDNIHAGHELHDSLRDLAAKLVASGMNGSAAVNFLRCLMEGSTAPHDERWQKRFDDIPRLVEGAEAFRQPAQDANKPNEHKKLTASPFVWRDPVSIPQRALLYGKHYIRQFLTCTIAPGGHGKTTLVIVEALAMVAHKPLLGVTPTEKTRVWLWNGEDPKDELDRRITAAMLQHQILPEQVEGHLFCDNGRETPIILAKQTHTGTVIARPVVDALIETIKHNQIGLLIIDPFVKSHRVKESDNDAIDEVARHWAEIADVTNCAIELLHHPRKTGGAEITVEDSRGAVALVDAARSVRVLNRMTAKQADEAGIEPAAAWRYFRIDNGKANMAPPLERADWYRLTSVPLGNGDDVGTVTTWAWPDPFEGVTVRDLRTAQKAVSEGGPWRADVRADEWVGKPIAKALKLNANNKSDRKKIGFMLKAWIKNGMFVEEEGEGRGRHKVQIVKVGTCA